MFLGQKKKGGGSRGVDLKESNMPLIFWWPNSNSSDQFRKMWKWQLAETSTKAEWSPAVQYLNNNGVNVKSNWKVLAWKKKNNWKVAQKIGRDPWNTDSTSLLSWYPATNKVLSSNGCLFALFLLGGFSELHSAVLKASASFQPDFIYDQCISVLSSFHF